MNKLILGSMLTVALLLGGALAYTGNKQQQIEPQANIVQKERTDKHHEESPKQEGVEIGLLRYGSYDTLAKLEEDSPYILVVDYKEINSVYKVSGSVFTEHTFTVKDVIKGESDLINQDIVVTETGGTYEGVNYFVSGDEPFGPGKYVLFLEKNPPNEERAYPRYLVQGVFSGKFKISNGKLRGFGEDPVRQEVETLTEQLLVKKVEAYMK